MNLTGTVRLISSRPVSLADMDFPELNPSPESLTISPGLAAMGDNDFPDTEVVAPFSVVMSVVAGVVFFFLLPQDVVTTCYRAKCHFACSQLRCNMLLSSQNESGGNI